MTFQIKKLETEKEIKSAAALHKETYERDHFTSRFPVFMLAKYYKEIADNNSYSFIAVDEHNEIVGVALAGENTRKSIKRFIRKYWYQLVFVLLLNPSFIFQKIRDFFIIFKKNTNVFQSSEKIRYLSLLVSPQFHRQGIAQLLTVALEDAMKKDGIKSYGHSVKANNIKTIKFHLKNGCIVEHQNEYTVYFIKKLV